MKKYLLSAIVILIIGILVGAIGAYIISEFVIKDNKTTKSGNMPSSHSNNITKVNESKNVSNEKNSPKKTESNYVGEAYAKRSAKEFLYLPSTINAKSVQITGVELITIEGKPFYKVSFYATSYDDVPDYGNGYVTVNAYDGVVWGLW